jgi:hypothetical protein
LILEFVVHDLCCLWKFLAFFFGKVLQAHCGCFLLLSRNQFPLWGGLGEVVFRYQNLSSRMLVIINWWLFLDFFSGGRWEIYIFLKWKHFVYSFWYFPFKLGIHWCFVGRLRRPHNCLFLLSYVDGSLRAVSVLPPWCDYRNCFAIKNVKMKAVTV